MTAPGDELAARRTRRTPRWITIAAAVAGVAVIGGGSYAFGLNNAPETVTAAPAISLEQPQGAEVARDSAGGGMESSMAAGAADTAKMMYPWFGGRTVFTASGLSTEGGSGGAWGFDAAGAYTEATIVAAAAALGVTGEPRLEYGVVDGRPERRLRRDGVAVPGRPREPVVLRLDAGPVELRPLRAGQRRAAGRGHRRGRCRGDRAGDRRRTGRVRDRRGRPDGRRRGRSRRRTR